MGTSPSNELARLVWQWIIDHHNSGYTSDDLIQDLENAGFPCPDDLKEN